MYNLCGRTVQFRRFDCSIWAVALFNSKRSGCSSLAEYSITFGDGVKPTERPVDDIMALHDDCTICFLGWAGRMAYHHSKNTVKRINYEKYINGDVDYIIR